MNRNQNRPKVKDHKIFILNYLICIFGLTNLILFIWNHPSTNINDSNKSINSQIENQSNTRNSVIRYINPISRHFSPFFNDTYTEDELEHAIEELHLPTWSRSYLHCSNSKSEVTCAQVVHSYRTLNAYVEYQNKTDFLQNKHVYMQHYYDGVANRMSTDTATFIFALYSNRTFTIESFYPCGNKSRLVGQAFELHPVINVRFGNNKALDDYFSRILPTAYYLDTFDSWARNNYDSLQKSQNVLLVNFLVFASFPYSHYQLGKFLLDHFGIHATYFICNFLMHIPLSAIEIGRAVIEPIPNDIVLFGVHLRFHQPNFFFAYDINRTLSIAIPFLQEYMDKKPTVFALATDSKHIEKGFKAAFPNNTLTTNARRKADKDHISALYDIALLEFCDKLLLTYRSSFSSIVAARTANRPYYIEKESPGVFRVSNSQSGMISMLYHQFDVHDWQVSRRFRLTPDDEYILRQYYIHLII